MAGLKGNIRSTTLQMNTSISVVLPEKNDAAPMKVIYLLHGLSDNADAWPDNTMLSIYADEYNVAFICPEVQRSFYSDMDFGLNYFTYIADELPALMSRYFNISTKREDTAIMGLSMGGFGALRVALQRPERFHLCAAFSSAIRIDHFLADQRDPEQKEWTGVFGHRDQLKYGEDLYQLVDNLCKTKPTSDIPTIHVSCGKQDFLYEQNTAFRDYVQQTDIDFHYDERDGDHNWYFWNESLKQMLDRYYR